MKASRVIVFVFFVLCLMTSCYTSNVTGLPLGQQYKSYVYSSVLVKDAVKATDKILVVFADEDFQRERIAETAIKSEFARNGIDCEILSDHATVYDINEMNDALADKLLATGVKVAVVAGLSSLNTYEYGNGVANMTTECFVYAADVSANDGVAIIISVATECLGNKFESYYESRENAIASMAKALVTEYVNSL